MKKNYLEIQEEIIKKYKIVIVENSTCWGRTHAHCDGTRRICKWKKADSVISTFELLHEIGHIMTTTKKMRRCESEYYATIWALERCKEYNIKANKRTIKSYQEYIDMELERGLKRSGTGYRTNYDISNYDANEIIEFKIKEPKPVKEKRKTFIL